jgi:hypothetical protein
VSRRSSTPTVTLFPFLAVLVCTMGALILLLLVTTRRIRQHTDLEAAAKLAAIGPQLPAPTLLPQALTETKSVAELAAEREARRREIEAQVAEHQAAARQREREINELRSRWEADVAELDKQKRELEQQLVSAQSRLGATPDAGQSPEAARKQLVTALEDAQKQRLGMTGTELRVRQEISRIEERLSELQQQLEAARLEQVLQKPKFEVVAYDGNSRTERRPILIDCRADALVFAAERIPLSADQLSRFVPDYNPLLAGARALSEYWKRADVQAGKTSSAPYVLLIVRPRGTVAFYVARNFLESLKTDWGYELVGENDEI